MQWFMLAETPGIFCITKNLNSLVALTWLLHFRPSSPYLAQAVIDGVESVQGCVTDFGVLSTPQLHFFVTCQNTNKAYGEPNEEGYFKKLASAFKALRGESADNGQYQHSLTLDGANGVGALKMKILQEYLGNSLEVSIFSSGDGKLNYQCGADYVKVLQKPPHVKFL